MTDRHPATVVLVHGAWHGAWCWSYVQAGLTDRGIPSVAVDLPGHGVSPLPLGDLYGDAAEVARVLATIEGPVVLVGHSYGGTVITEAAADRPNVAHLVYLAAFCTDVGESLMETSMGWHEHPDLGDAMEMRDDGASVLRPDAIALGLYGSCTVAQVAVAERLLDAQPMVTFAQPIRTATWRTIPSTFVVCSQDRAIVPSLQRHMATRCSDVIELDTDHSPFFSAIGETVALLARLAAAAS
jgi:pimeloyl-ACP methyl ester carboxylesterase